MRVLTREAAERAIRLADPEEVVRLAWAGAAASDAGAGTVLDLEYDEIVGQLPDWDGEFRSATKVLLWEVSREEHWRFYWLLKEEDGRGNWLDDDGVREALLRVREGLRWVGLDADERLPEALIDKMASAYNVRIGDRRAEEYVRHLKEDPDRPHPMPTTDDLLGIARPHLDRVYGAKG